MLTIRRAIGLFPDGWMMRSLFLSISCTEPLRLFFFLPDAPGQGEIKELPCLLQW